MKKLFALAATAALALASSSMAALSAGALISVSGAGDGPFATSWGTAAGQGSHAMGGSSTYFDPFFPAFTIGVSSSILSASSLSVSINFSAFGPGDFPNLTVDILNIKSDHTVTGVSASSGTATVNADGNGVHWTGTGASMAAAGTLTLKITQLVPAPGALAMLGAAGLVGPRRRRSC